MAKRREEEGERTEIAEIEERELKSGDFEGNLGHLHEVLEEEFEKVDDMCDSSQDEVLFGHYSCPAKQTDDHFDPMEAIEFPLSMCDSKEDTQIEGRSRKEGTMGQKRRGRPKRIGNSLPIPLSVQSTPTQYSIEALETWKALRTVGATTPNDGEMISELRKSKRIQHMEARNRARIEV